MAFGEQLLEVEVRLLQSMVVTPEAGMAVRQDIVVEAVTADLDLQQVDTDSATSAAEGTDKPVADHTGGIQAAGSVSMSDIQAGQYPVEVVVPSTDDSPAAATDQPTHFQVVDRQLAEVVVKAVVLGTADSQDAVVVVQRWLTLAQSVERHPVVGWSRVDCMDVVLAAPDQAPDRQVVEASGTVGIQTAESGR